ncbi:MAG: YidH family protein [Polymorphobacter sp.]|uniref:YidH family protein n=1 Tax=Polymorphobacter sp. TaxID=1909290 RepID=UPI003A87D07C
MSDPAGPNISTRLAQQRTSLAFDRTRQASDRTMMATLRTSFSLIGFGFTLFSFFRTLAAQDLLGPKVPERAPALFGLTLVLLGILVLAHGLWAERQFRLRLAAHRQQMTDEGLMPAEAPFPRGSITVAAFLLLLIGLFAVLAMAASLGPFA